MIAVTCEPYVLCNRTDEELKTLTGCHGMFTCNVVPADNVFPKSAIAEAVKYGGWQVIGEEIYCPHCAEIVAKKLLEAAK